MGKKKNGDQMKTVYKKLQCLFLFLFILKGEIV